MATQNAKKILDFFETGTYFYTDVQDAYHPFDKTGTTFSYSDSGMIGGWDSVWFMAMNNKFICSFYLLYGSILISMRKP